MGSERFVGQNSAHDTSKSSKSTAGGWEGIFANISLSQLMSSADLSAKGRRAGKKPTADKSLCAMLLTTLLQGSLLGTALTGMVTCLSQAPRNGEETYLSLK